MTGAVIADDSTRIDSAGAKVAEDTPFRLKGQKAHPWVSRGGMKLDHAIQEFALDVSGRVAIDVGCSTGGFTHVLLHHGASKVYAVDVGYGQLALQLRDDPRVAGGSLSLSLSLSLSTHTHTHTHCCVFARLYVGLSVSLCLWHDPLR